MIPGPSYVYQCPQCQNLLTRDSLASGNTFHSTWYSDGKLIAPMLPDFPNLTKCKKCNHLFWLNKLKEIGTFYFGDNGMLDWQNADEAEFLSLDDYFRAIELGVTEDKGEEGFVRQQIWWSFNDRVREHRNIFNDEAEESLYITNCMAFIELLNSANENEKMLIAEVYRNMGNFAKCLELINNIRDNELNWIVVKLRSECEKKNRWVILLEKAAQATYDGDD
jgi:hypothetical protein